MRRRLLLTGRARCGKSGLIASALGGDARRAGGFIVLSDGALLPAAQLALPEPRRRGREPFSARLAAEYLRAAGTAPFAVFDELGGAALADADYYEALIALLFSGTPLAGVLRRDGAPAAEWELLYGLLAADPDTLLLPTSGAYDINAAGALRHWAGEWANCT